MLTAYFFHMHPISYQGIADSYSEQALHEFCSKHAINHTPVSTHFFEELFESIQNETGLGFIPIENSTAGTVIQAQDLFLQYSDLTIIGEYILPIQHHLLATPGTDISQIKKVYSHPQALSQCSVFLDTNNMQAISFHDTAGAAKYIQKENNPTIAAIASKRAATLYNLKIISNTIQTNQNNATRFLLTKHKNKTFDFEEGLPAPDKTSIVFSGKDIPAHLYKCLGGFATNNINLLRLESRPHPTKQFDYIFYLDFEGTPQNQSVQNAFAELDYFCDFVHILGVYKAF